MALRTLTGCASSSTTSGTGTYTISATPPTGRRSLTNAVSAGAAANGDTVYACIADFTTSGPTFQFEYGLYTIGSGGLTLARTTILESSNSNLAVDWDSGGTRDVVFSTGNWVLAANNGTEFTAATFATNLGLPRLSAANIFTAVQTLTTAGETQLRLENSVAARSWGLRHATDGIFRIRDFTAGVEPLTFGAGGTTAVVGASTTLSKSGGSNYDNFPAGTKLLFGTAPPSGWTRVDDATTNRSILTSKAADTPGATGGSWTISGLSFSGTSGSTTLTESQIPSHTHPPGVGTAFIVSQTGSGSRDQTGVGTFWSGPAATGATGGGAGHTHSISGSPAGDGNWRPAYQVWCPAVKA